MDVELLRMKANRALLAHRTACGAVRRERHELELARKKYARSLDAQTFLQTVAAALQTKAHTQITKIVTTSLQTVFGSAYAFKIHFERKRGRTQARMVFTKNGHEINPTFEDGGGVLDIAAFALRLSTILLATPKRRRVLLLDEPFKWVHGDEYRRRTVQLLDMLSRDLQFQIIGATGLDWLPTGRCKIIPVG